MCRLCTASLFCVAGSVTSARVPASLPVPEVVGTCTSADASGPCTFSGPTTSWIDWPLAGQHGGELREVHGAAAAEADDEIGPRLAPPCASSASRFGDVRLRPHRRRRPWARRAGRARSTRAGIEGVGHDERRG